MKTLRGKILLGIIGSVFGAFIMINMIISNVFESNLEKNIIGDLEKIRSIACVELKDTEERLPILGSLSKSYKTYIALKKNEEETNLFTGKIINKDQIGNILKESNEKASIVYLGMEGTSYYATYAYPIYEEASYIETLVLQKDYTDLFLSDRKIMTQIILVEAMIYLMMLLGMFFWLTKTTRTLKYLAGRMNDLGQGDFSQWVPVVGSDEVAQLAERFNYMQQKLKEQIATIYEEKKKTEELSKQTRQFFNSATHEMKTPLTAIKGYGQLLEQNELEEEIAKGMAGRIVLESNRMYKLVENMLVVARGEAYKSQPKGVFDLKELIEEVAESYEVIAQKENKQLELDIKPLKIKATKEEMRTVWVNLIDNALKYSSGAKIVICTSEENPFQMIMFNQIDALPETIKKDLLQPFVKYNYGDYSKISSGLGLFISKELMEKNGFEFDYEVREGTICFIMTFT